VARKSRARGVVQALREVTQYRGRRLDSLRSQRAQAGPRPASRFATGRIATVTQWSPPAALGAGFAAAELRGTRPGFCTAAARTAERGRTGGASPPCSTSSASRSGRSCAIWQTCRAELVDHEGRPLIETFRRGQQRMLRLAARSAGRGIDRLSGAVLLLRPLGCSSFPRRHRHQGRRHRSLGTLRPRGARRRAGPARRGFQRKFYALPQAMKSYRAFRRASRHHRVLLGQQPPHARGLCGAARWAARCTSSSPTP